MATMRYAGHLARPGAVQAPRAVVAHAVPRRSLSALQAKDPDTQAQAAVDGGLISSKFASVLQEALARSGGDRALLENAAASVDEPKASPVQPVEEMLQTAIHTSRVTLNRLIQRQAELEAEIAKEQKQAARLEWLLHRVRSDYAYFYTLDKMNQESD